MPRIKEVDVVALQYDSGIIPESKTVDSGLFYPLRTEVRRQKDNSCRRADINIIEKLEQFSALSP